MRPRDVWLLLDLDDLPFLLECPDFPEDPGLPDLLDLLDVPDLPWRAGDLRSGVW